MSAIPVLKKHDVVFTEHEYRYEDRGGTGGLVTRTGRG